MAVLYRSLFAVIGLFALGLQYWLTITGNPHMGAGELTLNFFSYFTVLTNVVATLAFIAALLPPTTWAGRIGRSPQLRAAVAMYIAVVGLTYHFLLSHVWDPQGWLWISNGLLHYVMPIAFVADWVLFTSKGTLGWRDPAKWLAFPVVYTVWTLIHGYVSGGAEGWWPYWFMNVPALGLGKAAFWLVAMLAFFLAVGFGVVAIDRMLGRRDRTPASA
jgi:hypothetical protein